jgi:hypothetical protein
MGTNKTVLNKGIKKLIAAFPLLFIGPSVVYNAFINKNNAWHYLVLAIGIGLCFLAMFLIYKGIMLIISSMFDK